ncbi:MAG: hypothetical protein FJY65_01745 [Calditrichaeota bacterium]|nr:hypothetical protein [Calditrichota bacterium]
MSLKTNAVTSPSEVFQGARHILYIESEKPEGFDSQVINNLLNSHLRNITIGVEGLGVSANIRSAAEALYRINPNSYFLIDKDEFDDNYVSDSWRNFPNPNTHNLLIWPKRELENYFIEAEYIKKSQYFRGDRKDDIVNGIIDICQNRVFFDIANLTIIQIRALIKQKWIEVFTNPDEIKDYKSAVINVINRTEFKTKISELNEILSEEYIRKLLKKNRDSFLGRSQQVKLGHGRWLDLICGKEIMHQVFNQYFEVTDPNTNQPVQGLEKYITIARNLVVKRPLTEQPKDFQRLIRILSQKVK